MVTAVFGWGDRRRENSHSSAPAHWRSVGIWTLGVVFEHRSGAGIHADFECLPVTLDVEGIAKARATVLLFEFLVGNDTRMGANRRCSRLCKRDLGLRKQYKPMPDVKSVICQSRGSWWLVAAALIAAALSGCTAGTPFTGVISAPPGRILRLSWAEAKWTKKGIVVSGQVQQVHCCAFVRGHIHVDATGATGVVIASADVPWGDFNPRQLHSAWFRALLPVAPGQSVSAIEIKLLAER